MGVHLLEKVSAKMCQTHNYLAGAQIARREGGAVDAARHDSEGPAVAQRSVNNRLEDAGSKSEHRM